MNASVIASILYVTGFLSLYAAILLLPKSEKKLNGVMWLVLSLLTEMCWGAFVASIINLVRIPINIYSVGILYLASAVILGVKIHREKKIQKYEWSCLDILFSLAVFLVIAFMVYRKAGPGLGLMFISSDAAVHMKNAVSLVLTQRLPVMFFAPFQLGLVLEAMMPAVPIYHFYKIFIVVDAAFLGIEIIFFFQFCREYLKNWRMKVIGIVMCILYAAGYPMLSYLFTFYYWALGVMLFGFAALLLRMYREGEVNRQYLVFLLMLCLNASAMCYMLTAPMVFIATFLGLAAIVKAEGKLNTKTNIFLALRVFLLPTLLAVYYCLFEFLINQGMSATEIIATEGAIYRDLYTNFLLLLPIVLFMVVRAIHMRKADENMIFFLTIAVFVMALFVFAYKGKASSYYFYKFYYPLWFFCFALAIQGMERLMKEHLDVLASYGLVFAFLFALHFGKIEARIIAKGTYFQPDYREDAFFSLYDYNLSYLKFTGNRFPDKYMDICRYVVDELGGEENVPLISSFEKYEHCYWYEAMTGNDCSEYYEWWHDFDEVKEKLASGKPKIFAVFKDTEVFEKNADYFRGFEVIYENKKGVLYRNGTR